jgi:hypothetical protein
MVGGPGFNPQHHNKTKQNKSYVVIDTTLLLAAFGTGFWLTS